MGRRKSLISSANGPSVTIARVAGLLVALVVGYTVLRRHHQLQQGNLLTPLTAQAGARKDTLVLYALRDEDPQYFPNFEYFLKFGIQPDDRCDYVIIVPRVKTDSEEAWLPKLPASARYVFMPHYLQDCPNWGLFGWILETEHLPAAHHQYIILMDAVLRGPFLPSYLHGRVHWSEAFTSRLNHRVKLAGPSIQCAALRCPVGSTNDVAEFKGPFVQGLYVTDRVGLAAIRASEQVLRCYETARETLCNSDIGITLAIQKAGYTIDCLLQRYAGINWEDEEAHACGAGFNPTVDSWYDNTYIDPLEAVFIKINDKVVKEESPSAVRATKYSTWALRRAEEGPAAVQKNEYNDESVFNKAKAMRLLEMYARGAGCFDFDLYRRTHGAVVGETQTEQWEHFLNKGLFQGGGYKFHCNATGTEVVAQLMRILEQDPLGHDWHPEGEVEGDEEGAHGVEDGEGNWHDVEEVEHDGEADEHDQHWGDEVDGDEAVHAPGQGHGKGQDGPGEEVHAPQGGVHGKPL